MQKETEIRISCSICHITDALCTEFIEIGQAVADKSKKPMISVLTHLLESIHSQYDDDGLSNLEFCIMDDDVLCYHCYLDLLEYDDIIIRLMNLQTRFKDLLKDSNVFYRSPVPKPTEYIDSSSNNEIVYLPETYIVEEHLETELNGIETYIVEQDYLNDDENIAELEEIEAETDDMENSDFQDFSSISYIKCNHCDKEFPTRRRLGTHIENEHANQTIFRCSTCHKTFRNEEYLELHMNIHEGKTEYDCRYCPKRFSRKVNVIRHMQKHWNKQNFQCEKCGLRFSDNSLLYNHKLLHEAEETPIVCAVCQQIFKSKRTYKNHLLTHKEDRTRYPCEVCGKLFVEKYTLKVHQRSHEYNGHMMKNNITFENKEIPL